MNALDPAVRRSIYSTMVTIRKSDDAILSELGAGRVDFQYYPVRGQEAISAGAVAALSSQDYLLTTYRCLHDIVAKGVPLTEIFAEMWGRATGTSKGKGGAMHISDPNSGLMVTSGIVGGHIPIANGLALGAKLDGADRVAVASFGDGATSIGGFHESLNMAALWELPVIFLCQNNGFAEGTPFGQYSKLGQLSDRAAAYGMHGETIDGNDPVAVYESVARARERGLSGGGPTLIECVTFRMLGHFFGDMPEEYVSAERLAAGRATDPIPRFRAALLDSGDFQEQDLVAIENQADADVKAAKQFAESSVPPEISELLLDVFARTEDIPQWQ